jgi:GH15 family glucan-1,4-alpha-glucosidase
MIDGGGDALPLTARALIGDTETAALVAADGTIDWWCPGRFDADPALFGLLDPGGGAVRVAPVAGTGGGVPLGVQSYVGDSMVVRTVHAGPDGDLEVTDLMSWRGSGHRADGRIVRVARCLRGAVDVEVAVRPSGRWQPREPRDTTAWSEGIAFGGVVVATGCDMTGARSGRVRLEAGERLVVTIGTELEPLSPDRAADLVERTARAWSSRLAPVTYDGPYDDAVRRSLLTLLALTYGPSGTVVAAPTTSLPEHVGGERNWDYRYAWIRDASLSADACYDAGLHEEGERFLVWLRDVCHWASFPLHPCYDVEGGHLEPDERELPLAGWRGSQPVRVGNAAADHLQLDFYADLAALVHTEQLRSNDSVVLRLWDDIARMAEWLCDAWRSPDRGIWEIRAEPRHLVTSKLACWWTLQRLSSLATVRNPLDLDAARWRLEAADVRAWLDAHALADDGSLRCEADDPTDPVDAALLPVVWRNPWPDEPWRAARTVDRVLRRLGDGPFVHRYSADVSDGLPPGEGAFLACSFWAVEALARLGRWDEAHERMESLIAVGGPLGLLAEEVDPTSRELLGNYPQAFSHLALVQAAIALADGPP